MQLPYGRVPASASRAWLCAVAGTPDSVSDLVFHPSPRILAPDWGSRLRSAPAVTLLAACVLLVIGAVRDPSLQGWLYSFLAVAIVFVVPILLAGVNARLSISSDIVEYRGMLRVRRRCRRNDVTQLVRVTLAILGPGAVFRRLLLVNGEGEALLSIQEDLWSPDDLGRFQNELGCPIAVIDGAQYPSEVNRTFPGAASFALVHRWAITIAVLAIVLVTFLGVLGGTAHGTGH